ncbi:MAG: hypothetical protein RL417_2554, partial [Pseudomonadota bacterium]
MIVSPRVMRGNRSILSGFLAVAAVLSMSTGNALAAPTDGKAPNGAVDVALEAVADIAVTAIRIEPLGSSENALIGELSKPTTVSLKKTAPSEYVLSLENASIAATASTTLVAPPSAGTIRSIRPITESKGAA